MTKFGCSLRGQLEDHGQGVAHRREPAQPGVEEPARPMQPDGRRRRPAMSASEIWPSPVPTSPGSSWLIAVTRSSRAVGVDLGDVADDEEGQRQDREEGQEREVGDGAGLLAGVHRAVVLLHAHGVVDDRPAARAGSRAPAPRRSRGTAISSAAPRQGEVVGGLPAVPRRRGRRGGSRDVEARTRSRRARRRRGRAASSSRWWATVTCGWYGKRELDVERARRRTAAASCSQLGDALDQAHEHHRRDRPEGAGAAQVDAERRRASAATSPRCSSIVAQLASAPPRSAAPA